MTSDGDLWRMVVSHEREFGGVIASQKATDANVARIAERVETGFAENKSMLEGAMRTMGDTIAREGAHMRGEIGRLDEAYRQQRQADATEATRRREDERRQHEQVVAELRAHADRAESAATKTRQVNRRIIFVVVLIGALASAFFDNLPALINIVGHLFDAASL